MKQVKRAGMNLAVILASWLCATGVARAQSYAINWYTIDGGGGVSTNGLFTVRGTIGQPDAGRMGDGYYAVSGGFWGLFAIQTTGAPLLSVEKLGNGSARVYWPLPAPGFVMDQSLGLSNAPAQTLWTQVSFPYQTNAGQISITVSMPAGNKFYRLRKP